MLVRDSHSIALIIPALNEAANLPEVLVRVPEWVDRVCVVDNGSTDDTAAVARSLGALTVVETRRGYGWACAAGIAACGDLDLMVFADADASDDLSMMEQLVDPIVHDAADLVLGNRMAGLAEPGALSWAQRYGNTLACRLIRLRFNHPYADLGPFRAIRTRVLKALRMRQMTYGWTAEMQVRALSRGDRVLEVPVRYRARRSGRSKVSRSAVGILLAGYHIIRTILIEPHP